MAQPMSHALAGATFPPGGRLLVFGLLVLAVGLIYGQTSRFDFVHWDDPSYITDNYDVLGGLSWKSVGWAFTSTYFSNWHPLTWLSHQLAWDLFGPWAGGHHLANATLHLANACLCFVFLSRAAGAGWRAALVALLFAVHPLHVESVTWLSDRKGLLAALFSWLTLLAWMCYVRQPRRRYFFLALAAHACALMAKPMAVSLPLLMLVLDHWPLRRKETLSLADWGRLAIEKMPFGALSAVAASLTYSAQDMSGAVVSQDFLPLVDRLTNAIVAYQDYLVGLVWPTNLSFFYAYPLTWPVGRILVAMVLVASLVYFILAERVRRPYLVVGWLWFSVMLGPVIGLVQVGSQSHADRYMYMTSTGFFIALVWLLPEMTRGNMLRRWGGGLTVAVSLVVLGGLAHRQASTWRDSETLYGAALKLDPRNHVAHLLLGERLAEKKEWERAEYHARYALMYSDADSVQAYGNRVLGLVALSRGQFAEARGHFRQTLQRVPTSPKTHLYLGLVEIAAGNRDDAAFWLQRALHLRPRFPDALEVFAKYHADAGHYGPAIALQRQAVHLRPWLSEPKSVLNGYLGASHTLSPR